VALSNIERLFFDRSALGGKRTSIGMTVFTRAGPIGPPKGQSAGGKSLPQLGASHSSICRRAGPG
jgi:hypothetical protein